MTIKIKKEGKSDAYKSSKKILSSRDIKEADRFDAKLEKEIKEIERILVKEDMLSAYARKYDMLGAWYLIGTKINSFLKENKVSIEEENFFWNQLYGRSLLIGKDVPKNKVSKTRNDFRIASLLANIPKKKLQKIELWALWREVLTYKACRDERVLDWIIRGIEEINPQKRNDARPFLKATTARLKRIETTVLSDNELIKKLREVRWK